MPEDVKNSDLDRSKNIFGLNRIFVLLVLIGVGATGGYFFWLHNVPSVRISKVETGAAVQAVYATGNVEAVNWTKATPLVSAQIVNHCACEGREVKKIQYPCSIR